MDHVDQVNLPIKLLQLKAGQEFLRFDGQFKRVRQKLMQPSRYYLEGGVFRQKACKVQEVMYAITTTQGIATKSIYILECG